MEKMDSARFQEQSRQDRKKLIAGIAVVAILSLALSLVGTDLRNMTPAGIIRLPLMIIVFISAAFLALHLTKKMERDSYEEGMHLVMEGAPMNCTLIDEKGTVLYCNDHSVGMFNAGSKREYAEKLFGDFLPEFQPDGARSMDEAGKHMQAAFENGTESFEWWHQLGPGKEQFPCAITLTAATVYGMSRILVYLTDKRKDLEAERKREDAVRERMRVLMDSTPLLCGIYDENGNAVEVNKEAERMFDIPDRKMLIANLGSFMPPRQPCGTDSMQKNFEMFSVALKEGYCEYEWVYQHPTGQPIPTTEILHRVEIDGKNVVISYSRDMRAEHAAREAEQAAQKRLQIMTDRLNGQLETQSSAITESSAAIEQMIANTQSVSNTLSKNARNVQDLQEAAAVGQSGLNEVVKDFKEIAKESESLLEINSVMQNIASQTNLLSMNAAIEAAHAGESGRGFAVVADEIRKLAESSSRQSKTVGGVLKKMKGSIDKITKSTDNVMNRFEAIDDGVKTVAEQESGIMNAMAEQSAGSAQVMQAIAQVNDITGQVKEDARKIVEAAAKLGV